MDNAKAIFTGTSAVGAMGPMRPTAGLFGSGGSFDLSQTLKTTTSLGSAVSTGFGTYGYTVAGKQAQQQYNLQAGSQELQADVARLNAVEQATLLRKQLLLDLSSANASAAARGIDVGSGTPRQIVQQSISDVQTAAAKIEAGGQIEAKGFETAATRSRAQGASAAYGGYTRAASGLGKYIMGSL